MRKISTILALVLFLTPIGCFAQSPREVDTLAALAALSATTNQTVFVRRATTSDTWYNGTSRLMSSRVNDGRSTNLDNVVANNGILWITNAPLESWAAPKVTAIGVGLTNSAGTLQSSIAAGSGITLTTNNQTITFTASGSAAVGVITVDTFADLQQLAATNGTVQSVWVQRAGTSNVAGDGSGGLFQGPIPNDYQTNGTDVIAALYAGLPSTARWMRPTTDVSQWIGTVEFDEEFIVVDPTTTTNYTGVFTNIIDVQNYIISNSPSGPNNRKLVKIGAGNYPYNLLPMEGEPALQYVTYQGESRWNTTIGATNNVEDTIRMGGTHVWLFDLTIFKQCDDTPTKYPIHADASDCCETNVLRPDWGIVRCNLISRGQRAKSGIGIGLNEGGERGTLIDVFASSMKFGSGATSQRPINGHSENGSVLRSSTMRFVNVSTWSDNTDTTDRGLNWFNLQSTTNTCYVEITGGFYPDGIKVSDNGGSNETLLTLDPNTYYASLEVVDTNRVIYAKPTINETWGGTQTPEFLAEGSWITGPYGMVGTNYIAPYISKADPLYYLRHPLEANTPYFHSPDVGTAQTIARTNIIRSGDATTNLFNGIGLISGGTVMVQENGATNSIAPISVRLQGDAGAATNVNRMADFQSGRSTAEILAVGTNQSLIYLTADRTVAILGIRQLNNPGDNIMRFFSDNSIRGEFETTNGWFYALDGILSDEGLYSLGEAGIGTNLRVTNFTTMNGRVFFNVSSPITLAAGDTITRTSANTNRPNLRIQSASGNVTMTSTPTMTAGTAGEFVILGGQDATATITVQDSGTLAGSGFRLNRPTAVFGRNTPKLPFIYDAVRNEYSELGRIWTDSISMTVPTGLSVSPSTITTNGTFAITTTLNGNLRGNGSGFVVGPVDLASADVTGVLGAGNINWSTGLTNVSGALVGNYFPGSNITAVTNGTQVTFSGNAGTVTGVDATVSQILGISGANIIADDQGAPRVYGWGDAGGAAAPFTISAPLYMDDGTFDIGLDPGAGLSIVGSELVAQWQAGTVTSIGNGATNSAGVLSGNYRAGSNVTFTTNATEITIAATGASGYTTVEVGGSPLTQRANLNFSTPGFTGGDNNPDTDIGLDLDLQALAQSGGTGVYVVTGSGTSATRTVASANAAITVANGDGVSGNPTLTFVGTAQDNVVYTRAVAANPVTDQTLITVPVTAGTSFGALIKGTFVLTDGTELQGYTTSWFISAANKSGTISGDENKIGSAPSDPGSFGIIPVMNWTDNANNTITYNIRHGSALPGTVSGSFNYRIENFTGQTITVH